MRGAGCLRVGCAALALLVAALPARAQAVTTRGEVVRVERPDGPGTGPGGGAGRLTLKHAEIKNLEMPPMTMVFHVANAELLEGLAAGDRVRFTAERIEGRYTVTTLYRTP